MLKVPAVAQVSHLRGSLECFFTLERTGPVPRNPNQQRLSAGVGYAGDYHQFSFLATWR